MNNKSDAKGDIRPQNSNLVFFCFVLAALLTAVLCYVNKNVSPATAHKLLQAMALVLLMSAAYSGSAFALVCLPWMAALLGAISALGFCLVALVSMNGGGDNFNILPVLLLAVPIQFLVCAAAMGSQRNHREKIRLKAQGLITLLSLIAATGITVWIIFG